MVNKRIPTEINMKLSYLTYPAMSLHSQQCICISSNASIYPAMYLHSLQCIYVPTISIHVSIYPYQMIGMFFV